ncbi:hypothetical protein [Actinoplanes couchii]|uniref:Uncharacterized protein n=1 Tax=Actinoplanes couchii TaxID=403638 RepID=A0ABQ3XMK5_9ACTN|nr:hypothetical protein [Actinoplanes couchii]MDR6321647.1 hypothetical protein [Actinoplanes couchii]GID59743.1 hypothetical protein Aco03nite_081470 [Actinoplanes couchii]
MGSFALTSEQGEDLGRLRAGGAEPVRYPGAELRGFPFVENGEASFGEIGAAIADRLGLGPVQPWNLTDAGRVRGEGFARFALGADSRVRAVRARRLGWTPRHASAGTWIRDSMRIS